MTYQYQSLADSAVAPIMKLPVPSIQISGSISLIDNLGVFGQKLAAFIEGLPANPSTDQEFAEAEAAIKTLEVAQKSLEIAESGALAQTASIDEMRRTVALYVDQARTTRLALAKLVTARKEQIRIQIVQQARRKLDEHICSLNARLGKPYMPTTGENFAGVIKGKKTITSLQEACDTELAKIKIEANVIADRIQINLNCLRETAKDHAFLFADTPQLVLKDNDDFAATVKLRIAEHRRAEAGRLEAERARIRVEEQAKAEAEASVQTVFVEQNIREHIRNMTELEKTNTIQIPDETSEEEESVGAFLGSLDIDEEKKNEIRTWLLKFIKFTKKYGFSRRIR